MSNTKTAFTTPVGRLVQGSLYKPNTTDAEGKPLVVKSGPNMGKPRVDYYFAIAIPKGAETHWALTEWGAKIWTVGHAAFPNVAQSPKFAWKVTDGDSVIPDQKGRKPCDREGFPGHWVIKFSGGFAPKIVTRESANHPWVENINENVIRLGYYVQINGTIEGNGSQQQPGVYLNHAMVAMLGFGPEIVIGPDANSAGFGASPLPAGASTTPLPGQMPAAPPAATPVAAPPPLVPGLPPAPNSAPASPSAPAPAAPVSAPPVAVRTMTAKAGAHTYDSYKATGWTDAMLIAEGMMIEAAQPVPAPLPPSGSAPMPPGVASAAPAIIPVTPNPTFLQVPAPPVAAPAPVAAARVMLPAANGISYETYIANKWTDAQLVQHGMMQAA